MDIQFLYSLVKTSSFLHCSPRSSLSSIKWRYMGRSVLGTLFCYAVIYSKIFIWFFCILLVFIFLLRTLFSFNSEILKFIQCSIVTIATLQFLIILAVVIMGLACVDFLSSCESVTFSWFFPCQVLLYCILGIMNILLWSSGFCSSD